MPSISQRRSPGGSAGGGPDAASVRGDRGGLGRLQDLSDGCGAHGVAKLRKRWENWGKTMGKTMGIDPKNWEKHLGDSQSSWG